LVSFLLLNFHISKKGKENKNKYCHTKKGKEIELIFFIYVNVLLKGFGSSGRGERWGKGVEGAYSANTVYT
jgi:hypothetical protein